MYIFVHMIDWQIWYWSKTSVGCRVIYSDQWWCNILEYNIKRFTPTTTASTFTLWNWNSKYSDKSYKDLLTKKQLESHLHHCSKFMKLEDYRKKWASAICAAGTCCDQNITSQYRWVKDRKHFFASSNNDMNLVLIMCKL